MERIIVSICFLLIYAVFFAGTFLMEKNNRKTNIFRVFVILTAANVLLYIKEVLDSLYLAEPVFERVMLIRTLQSCLGFCSYACLAGYLRLFIKGETRLQTILIRLYYVTASLSVALVTVNYFFRFFRDANNEPVLPDTTLVCSAAFAFLCLLSFILIILSRLEGGYVVKLCFILFIIFAIFDTFLQFTVYHYLYGVGSFIDILLCVFFMQIVDSNNDTVFLEKNGVSEQNHPKNGKERGELLRKKDRLRIYMYLLAVTMLVLCALVPVLSMVCEDHDRISTISGMFMAIELLLGIYMTLIGGRFGTRLALSSFIISIIMCSIGILFSDSELALAGLLILFAGCLSVFLILTYMDKRENVFSTMLTSSLRTFASMIESRDKYTGGHSYRVSMYAALIAEKIGYGKDEIIRVKRIGLLHDCGKLGISDLILNKQGKLTEEEYSQIKTHPQLGANLLMKFNFIDGMNSGALYHHERYDGTGYPIGLAGEAIPEIGRIIAVADAFDAMNSVRCYREKLTIEKIVSELETNKGKQFDPRMADIMINIVRFEWDRIEQIMADGT